MIKNITLNELEEKCIDLLSETYIALGQHNHEPETTMLLAKKLAKDLKRRYSRLSWECIEMAFDNGINKHDGFVNAHTWGCLLYTSPSPRDLSTSRMPSSA